MVGGKPDGAVGVFGEVVGADGESITGYDTCAVIQIETHHGTLRAGPYATLLVQSQRHNPQQMVFAGEALQLVRLRLVGVDTVAVCTYI